MNITQTDYGMAILVRAPFDAVVAWVTEALREQGFGVLTTVDVRETLRVKADVQIEPYLILGACNPSLATRALDIDRQVGVLLPCNVVVRAVGDAVAVEAVRPEMLVAVTGRAEFEQVAAEATRRLSSMLRVVADVAR